MGADGLGATGGGRTRVTPPPSMVISKGKCARPGQRYVEHKHCPCLDFRHPGHRFAELDAALAAQELGVVFVHEADADGVGPDVGPAPPDTEHEVRPGVDGGEFGHPDVLEDAQHRELPCWSTRA